MSKFHSLNELQQQILEEWFESQEALIQRLIINKGIEVLAKLVSESNREAFESYIGGIYRDSAKTKRGTLRELLCSIHNIARGHLKNNNNLYKYLTSSDVTDIAYQDRDNKEGIKYLVGVLFRAYIASYVIENSIEICNSDQMITFLKSVKLGAEAYDVLTNYHRAETLYQTSLLIIEKLNSLENHDYDQDLSDIYYKLSQIYSKTGDLVNKELYESKYKQGDDKVVLSKREEDDKCTAEAASNSSDEEEYKEFVLKFDKLGTKWRDNVRAFSLKRESKPKPKETFVALVSSSDAPGKSLLEP